MEQKNRLEGKTSSLTDSRYERLRAVGFRWAKRKGQASWDEKFVSMHIMIWLGSTCWHTHSPFVRSLASQPWILLFTRTKNRMNSRCTRPNMVIVTFPPSTRAIPPSDVGYPLNERNIKSIPRVEVPRLPWMPIKSASWRRLDLLGSWRYETFFIFLHINHLSTYLYIYSSPLEDVVEWNVWSPSFFDQGCSIILWEGSSPVIVIVVVVVVK